MNTNWTHAIWHAFKYQLFNDARMLLFFLSLSLTQMSSLTRYKANNINDTEKNASCVEPIHINVMTTTIKFIEDAKQKKWVSK